jgi:hypothetical protein
MIVTALQILFSLIRYVTETIRSVSVFFSDSEDEPDDPNIIYEEPDDEASSSDKDVSDATLPARTTFSIVIFWRVRSGGTKEMLSISQKKADTAPPHAPTVRLPRNRKGRPGARASWVGV